MTHENQTEAESAELPRGERRPYEAPAVKDFFQPLVVLGTSVSSDGIECATPKPPKHP